jgi:hypothetical protein
VAKGLKLPIYACGLRLTTLFGRKHPETVHGKAPIITKQLPPASPDLLGPGLDGLRPSDGQFSISHYLNLKVEMSGVELLYIIDMAEVPTFQDKPELDANSDGSISPAERALSHKKLSY